MCLVLPDSGFFIQNSQNLAFFESVGDRKFSLGVWELGIFVGFFENYFGKKIGNPF